MDLKKSIDSTKNEPERRYKGKRRAGTTGVTGSLYETKLLSLILFRALRDKEVEEFYLGSNLDIGAFDDICFKFKHNDKWVAAFMQLKHKINPQNRAINNNSLKTDTGDFSLKKYLLSYCKIIQQYKNITKTDHLFAENFEDTECRFIIYTPARNQITKKKYTQPNTPMNKIREWVWTSHDDDVCQIKYNDEEVMELASLLIDKQLNLIAKALADCIVSNKKKPTMDHNKEIIKKYQLFLISDVICQDGVEEWKFNDKIMFSNNYECIKLREIIINDLLKSTKNTTDAENNLNSLTESGCVDVKHLSKVIGSIVIYDKQTHELDLIKEADEKLEKYRKPINKLLISQTVVQEALYQAGKNVLLSVRFKLPAEFKTGPDCGEHFFNNNVFDEEINITRQFLNNLYFYTKQPTHDKVEKMLKNELHNCIDNNVNKTSLSAIKSETLFLKFHDTVQKWSTLIGNVYYLTKNCDFYDKSIIDMMEYMTYISILNFNCIKELKKYDIDFKNMSVDKLRSKLFSLSLKVTIFTNIVMLTSVKLFQCLRGYKSSFINFDAILKLTVDELQILLDEIEIADLDFLVIIIKYEIEEYDKCKSLNRMINVFSKKLIIVSDQNELIMYLKSNQNFVNFPDTEINFIDLDESCQKQLLDYNNEASCKIITQGQEAPLGLVIDDSSKHLISGDILLMILKNEKIIIGKNLVDEKYASIQQHYIPQRLEPLVYDYHIQDNIFVQSPMTITAKPGMGKSTLLSHTAIQIKSRYPRIWIVRFNLIDHCSKFKIWKEEETDINLKDTMTLVCNSELENAEGTFELQVTDGVLELKHTNMKGSALLHIEFIIYSYNNGNMIFLFDGFDEICPHYQNVGVKFIKNLVRCKKQFNPKVAGELQKKTQKKLWIWKIMITSRPYNSITQILEKEFSKTCELKPWSAYDRQMFCDNYFESNIKIEELSPDQFKNIESFFEYMSQFRRVYGHESKMLQVTNVALHIVYDFAVDYFRNAILQAPLNVDKEELTNKWVSRNDLFTVYERCHESVSKIKKTKQLVDIPLHMFIAVNFFLHEIINAKEHKNEYEKWDLNVNTFEYYERFFETKLKIRFKEKNRRYTSCPDEIMAYKKEKKHFMDIHKELAFYALFHHNKQYFQVITNNELTMVKKNMRHIENGKEKTGLIHRIHNKVPRFIHLVFAEYFAVEYISDKIKRAKKDSKRKRYLNFIVNCLLLSGSVGVMTVFNHKLEYDRELSVILTYHKTKHVFKLLLEQHEMIEYDMYDDFEYNDRHIQSSLFNAISNRLNNVVKFLLNGLNEDDLKRFIEIAENLILSAASFDLDDIIIFVLNRIRMLDSVAVNEVLSRSKLSGYLKPEGGLKSNEEILNEIYTEVKNFVIPYCFFNPDE